MVRRGRTALDFFLDYLRTPYQVGMTPADVFNRMRVESRVVSRVWYVPMTCWQTASWRLSSGVDRLMCGIVGYIGPRPAVPIILDGLRHLEYRGYDSAGLAVLEPNNGLCVRRAQGKLRNLEDALRLNPVDGPYGIGHTRWATHG